MTKEERAQFYASPAWRRLVRAYRGDHPMCEDCLTFGRYQPTDEIDHIWPLLDGGASLDRRNLRALCRSCHRAKERAEYLWRKGKRGVWGCDADGNALNDPPGVREEQANGEED